MKKYRLDIQKGLKANQFSFGMPWVRVIYPWVRVIYPAAGFYITSLASFRTVQEAVDYIGFRIKERKGPTPIELVLEQTEIPLELAIRWEKEKSENIQK